MKKPTAYNLTPAKGQAILNFQGRLFPEQVELFETKVIEEIRQKDKKVSKDIKQKDLNADFRNLLIHGDCLSACAYLKSQNIKVDLVYIDPPFASGANYAKKIYLRNGDKSVVESEDTSIGEEILYADIWQKEDYLNWLFERLLAIRELMAEKGSIYVHLDWHIGHYVKILLDEVFGEGNFQREIIWSKGNVSGFKGQAENWIQAHDSIYYYTKSGEDYIFNKKYIDYSKAYLANFNKVDKKGKEYWQWSPTVIRYLEDLKGLPISDVWDIKYENNMSTDRTDYPTQKPEELVKKLVINRIIESSAKEDMIVADFFVGSGTASKCANDLKCKFIACDIGLNAIQTTRDRLIEAKAEFDILKINDGVRLFRNPAQTTAKIFSLLDGFKNRTDLELGDFWDGGIANDKGTYTPVKFIGIHEKLTKELIDVILEEIYQLQDDSKNNISNIKIIYAHKDLDVDDVYISKEIKRSGKTTLKVELLNLDDLLGQKADKLFSPDNADLSLQKIGSYYKVEIKKYFSGYLKSKIDDYNAKKVKKDNLHDNEEGKKNKTKKFTPIKISNTGLELIESVQFDTTLKKNEIWVSNLELEDKAGIKDKIKGIYTLQSDKFKVKIRNIAGDEIVVGSEELTHKK